MSVTLTYTSYVNIVAEHVQAFMASVFPDGFGHEASCHAAKTVEEYYFLRSQFDRAAAGLTGTIWEFQPCIYSIIMKVYS